MTPAQTLRAWRGDATQAQAAAALGVSRRTYEGWESGASVKQGTLGPLLIAIRFVSASGHVENAECRTIQSGATKGKKTEGKSNA